MPIGRRLLVIAGDSIRALLRAGYDAHGLARYYNPADAFAEVRILNWFQDAPQEPLRLLDVPPVPGVGAWREAIADPWAFDELATETVGRFFPGVPGPWLAAVREYAPDCIRAYEPVHAGFLAMHVARELGVPLLLSVHNTRGMCADVLKAAATVLCVSETVARRCIELGADPAVTVTVYNGVDRTRFNPDGQAAAGPEGRPRLLCVARDHPQKNLDRLLAACESARERLPNLSLVHAGISDRDWSRFAFARHLPAIPQSEMPQWMRWADALVLPSLWEGFGKVLAEALACGTPCITSRRGPMDEIVSDNWNGLLVDPENTADIARAIVEVADPTTQARLAAPARASSEKFDLEVVGRRQAGVYRAMLRSDWPLLSIVLPTYNRAQLIEKAVRNVLAQDHPNFELIVVNDGSKDQTAEVLAKLTDPRLRVITQENRGLPKALNAGFAEARGELWTWTSDDNAYRPGALKAMARELELDPEAGLVYADMMVTDEKGHQQLFTSGPPESALDLKTIGACFMYRAAVARVVGEYDDKLRLVEDYDYWLRMQKVARFIWLPRVLYDYGDVPFSLTRTELPAVERVRRRLLEREFGSRRDWKELKLRHYLQYAATAKNYGLVFTALAASVRAVLSSPGTPAAWRALARSMTPRPLLRLTRRLRGLDDT